jgi:Cu+-exporting ATPase
MVGTGVGAENGILIKGGESLETAHRVNAVIFDKTGTLTHGKPVVTDIIAVSDTDEVQILRWAASAEKRSEHPLGEAVVETALQRGIDPSDPEDFETTPGLGISAKVEGHRILVGNQEWMQKQSIHTDDLKPRMEKLSQGGKTVMLLAVDGKITGILAVADTPKENSVSVIKELRDVGIETIMLTGDNRQTGEAVGKQVGVDRIIAEVLPEDKADEVKRLQEQGKIVAMVGDGINDAPALAQADIGIAIGTGTDVAIETSDITLMRDDLDGVVRAIRLSHRTMRTIKQNLFWAFIYNIIGIPIAAGVLYPFFGILLKPVFAAAAMSMSSVSVVSNSLRLKRFKPK